MGQIEVDNTEFEIERHDRINHVFILTIDPKEKSLPSHKKRVLFDDIPNRRQLTDDVIRKEIERWKDIHDVDQIRGAGVMEQFVVRTIDAVDEVTDNE